MVIGGFLEMLSVSLILPFMNAVMSPDETMRKWYVKLFCDIFNIDTATRFLVVLSFVLGIVYILKNVYLILENNYQYRFVYGNMFSFQSKLLNAYLHRPYEYYLSADSGEIIRIISDDTMQTFQLLTYLLSFFTELIVAVILIGTVFFITPYITICIAVVLIFVLFVINFFIRPRMRKAGAKNQKAYAGMNKWMLQSIQGIKDVLVMGKEDYFQSKFDEHGKSRVEALRKNNILESIPRFLIEAITMSTMFILVGIMIYRGQEIETMIPILTAVAMAALRLLPSVNRMSSSLAGISYREPMLDKMIENLTNISGDVMPVHTSTANDCNSDREKTKISPMKKSLRLSSITYQYPQGECDVLSGAELTIYDGESVGLVGASGAGKTTAVDIILGLLQPKSGQVLVDGVDIRNDMPGWLSQIGYIPQMIFMLDDTILANVAFGEEPSDVSEQNVWSALEEASLDEFVRSLPNGLDTEIGERGVRLSGGQRQRIGIARALYRNPGVLIFDEATSALDNETESAIMESINNLHGRKTMIIIAHRLTTIENCDKVYRVENKTIILEEQRI